jgi:hypothetical protein
VCRGGEFIAADTNGSCVDNVALNALVSSCDPLAASLSCNGDASNILQSGSCSRIARAINFALGEFAFRSELQPSNWPRLPASSDTGVEPGSGSRDSGSGGGGAYDDDYFANPPIVGDSVGCTLGGFLKVHGNCEEVVSGLNAMTSAFLDGLFTGCARTTATTTLTTTATFTTTTTPTTTQTTTATTTPIPVIVPDVEPEEYQGNFITLEGEYATFFSSTEGTATLSLYNVPLKTVVDSAARRRNVRQAVVVSAGFAQNKTVLNIALQNFPLNFSFGDAKVGLFNGKCSSTDSSVLLSELLGDVTCDDDGDAQTTAAAGGGGGAVSCASLRGTVELPLQETLDSGVSVRIVVSDGTTVMCAAMVPMFTRASAASPSKTGSWLDNTWLIVVIVVPIIFLVLVLVVSLVERNHHKRKSKAVHPEDGEVDVVPGPKAGNDDNNNNNSDDDDKWPSMPRREQRPDPFASIDLAKGAQDDAKGGTSSTATKHASAIAPLPELRRSATLPHDRGGSLVAPPLPGRLPSVRNTSMVVTTPSVDPSSSSSAGSQPVAGKKKALPPVRRGSLDKPLPQQQSKGDPFEINSAPPTGAWSGAPGNRPITPDPFGSTGGSAPGTPTPGVERAEVVSAPLAAAHGATPLAPVAEDATAAPATLPRRPSMPSIPAATVKSLGLVGDGGGGAADTKGLRTTMQAASAFNKGPLPPRAMPTLGRPSTSSLPPVKQLNPAMREKILQLSEEAKALAAADAGIDHVPPNILRLCKIVSVAIKKEMMSKSTRLSHVYTAIDVDGNKKVTLLQFTDGLNRIGTQILTDAEAQELFKYADAGAKGYLTMADFGRIFAPFRKKADPFARRPSVSSLAPTLPPPAGDANESSNQA